MENKDVPCNVGERRREGKMKSKKDSRQGGEGRQKERGTGEGVVRCAIRGSTLSTLSSASASGVSSDGSGTYLIPIPRHPSPHRECHM